MSTKKKNKNLYTVNKLRSTNLIDNSFEGDFSDEGNYLGRRRGIFNISN